MALTTILELETHPDGTVGVNALITGNWSRLETIFDPALSNTDAAYEAIWRAFVRSATDPTTEGANVEWSVASGKPIWREGYEAISESSPYSIDAEGAQEQFMSITANLNLQSLSNQAAGAHVRFFIQCDGTTRNLNFPAGWVFMDAAAPANIAANKLGELDLFCLGAADSNVVARWHVEP